MKPRIRKILTYPDPVLKTKCDKVSEHNDDIKQIEKDLKKTVKHNNGAGLAAPQIGETKQIITVLIVNGSFITLINPEIIKCSDAKIGDYEGCLSVPDYTRFVHRHKSITVKYGIDRMIEKTFTGMMAREIEHELDHLNGVLINDEDAFDYICSECAAAKGGLFPDDHLATMNEKTCSFCGCKKAVCAVNDYQWPDKQYMMD